MLEKLIKRANDLESALNSLKANYQALVKVTKFRCTCDQRQEKREMEADIKTMSKGLEILDYDIAYYSFYGVAL